MKSIKDYSKIDTNIIKYYRWVFNEETNIPFE